MRRVAAFVELMHILHTQHNITDPKDFYYGSFSNNIMSALLSTLYTQENPKHTHAWILFRTCFMENTQKYTMKHIENLQGIYINKRICLELHVSQKNPYENKG